MPTPFPTTPISIASSWLRRPLLCYADELPKSITWRPEGRRSRNMNITCILGRHGSDSLCRDERENKMAATYNVLAFKRWYFAWWWILYVQRHLDLLSGVAPSYSSKEIARNCCLSDEPGNSENRVSSSLFFSSSFFHSPSTFTWAVLRPKHPRTVVKFSWHMPFEHSF